MASRLKEDERNERIIRGLLKLPANRRCINCNNLGPQYICTNFWTFICTNCSGIHREFTHRVKSISMAKFTSQEVSALQEGGNERAKEKYFKEWDQQRHSFPDSSNNDRLRDFIKHVYVDRRYTGERNIERTLRSKSDKEDFFENRREDSHRGVLRSPQYGDTYERRYIDRSGSGGRYDNSNLRYGYGERSPGYDKGYKRSPVRFEVVDDRYRDDRLVNGNHNWKFLERRFSDLKDKAERKSPNHQKDVSELSPPMVRPVREILSDDAPQLRVGDLPKPIGSKVPDTSLRTQRTSSSISMGSNDGNSVESKAVNLRSLIDIDTDSEPPVAAAPQQSILLQSTSQPATDGDWASFDVVARQTTPHEASNTNLLQSALVQLSAPLAPALANSSPSPLVGVDSSKATVGGQWQTIQQQQQPSSVLLVADSQATNLPLNTTSVGALNKQGPVPVVAGQPSQDTTTAHKEAKAPNSPSPPPHVEAKPTERKELPQDLFTALYPSASVSAPAWPRGPQYSMGFGMQYPTGAVIPAFPQPLKSANPFDFSNEPTVNHSSSFPSLASLQGVLPNTAGSSPLVRTTSFGAQTLQWMLPQPPSFPSGSYMVQQGSSVIPQQTPNNMFSMMHQEAGGFGSEGAAFVPPGMDQHSTLRYSQPGTSNSVVPVGGNPFG